MSKKTLGYKEFEVRKIKRIVNALIEYYATTLSLDEKFPSDEEIVWLFKTLKYGYIPHFIAEEITIKGEISDKVEVDD